MLISEAVIHLGIRSVDARLITEILLDDTQPNSIIANYSKDMTERLRMPVKTVSMSSRDPPWMTPLLESMMIRLTNSRVSCLSKDRLCLVSKRIADVISEK